ncbi:MAG: cupin domain-containing protein [Oscillospiraceae bacterium]|jgi:glucose-6-phosphate isomerase|nr:cupin domain-containing protein [Oscillospiraceae bacterium]
MSAAPFDWDRGFALDFALADGLSRTAVSTKRRLSQMRGMYSDGAAFEALLAKEDPLVYEFYELGAPDRPGGLAFGTSVTYPGRVGREYFMTKGHFHTILDTAEVYYCLSGQGVMLMENPEGDVTQAPLTPGQAVYVPGRFAHRSVNTGDTPLVTFFVFRGDAGHDYGTIEEKGFRNLIVERDGAPQTVGNPRWK